MLRPLTVRLNARIGQAVEDARKRVNGATHLTMIDVWTSQLAEAGELLERYLLGNAVDLSELDVINAFSRVGQHYGS